MLKNRSLTICILGLCTFAVALTTFHALLLWAQYGPTETFEIYFLSSFVGPIPIGTYFLVSLILTCVLFGATSFAAFRYSHEFDRLMELTSVIDHNTKDITRRAHLLSEKTKIMEEVLRQSISQNLDTKMDDHTRAIGAKVDGLTARIDEMERVLKIREDSRVHARGISKEPKKSAKKPERSREKEKPLEELEIEVVSPKTSKGKESSSQSPGESWKCPYHFGYLRTLPPGTSTPEECYSCPKIMRCLYSDKKHVEPIAK